MLQMFLTRHHRKKNTKAQTLKSKLIFFVLGIKWDTNHKQFLRVILFFQTLQTFHRQITLQ